MDMLPPIPQSTSLVMCRSLIICRLIASLGSGPFLLFSRVFIFSSWFVLPNRYSIRFVLRSQGQCPWVYMIVTTVSEAWCGVIGQNLLIECPNLHSNSLRKRVFWTKRYVIWRLTSLYTSRIAWSRKPPFWAILNVNSDIQNPRQYLIKSVNFSMNNTWFNALIEFEMKDLLFIERDMIMIMQYFRIFHAFSWISPWIYCSSWWI
jgi:hypothetical protein